MTQSPTEKALELIDKILGLVNWNQVRLKDELRHTHEFRTITAETLSRWVTKKNKPSHNAKVLVKRLQEIYTKAAVNGQVKAQEQLRLLPKKERIVLKLPIVTTVPNGSIKEKAVLDYIEIPNWLLGGNYEDCYILQIRTADLLPEFKPGNVLIIQPGEGSSGDTLLATSGPEEKLLSIKLPSENRQKIKVIGVIIATINNLKGSF